MFKECGDTNLTLDCGCRHAFGVASLNSRTEIKCHIYVTLYLYNNRSNWGRYFMLYFYNVCSQITIFYLLSHDLVCP